MPPPPRPGMAKALLANSLTQSKTQITVNAVPSSEIKPKYSTGIPKYSTGILIWAKMTGHPWWPCMVTDDPLLNVHCKVNGRPSSALLLVVCLLYIK